MNRPANFTPNSTSVFSRQKSSDIKYIKRTKSKIKRQPSKQLEALNDFKKRIANNQCSFIPIKKDSFIPANSGSFITINTEQTKECKQKSKKNLRSHSSEKKNQAHKQNREQNSQHQSSQNRNQCQIQQKKQQNLSKLMGFGMISNKNRSNFSSQQIVFLSSRGNNNNQACGSTKNNPKNQQKSNTKQIYNHESYVYSYFNSLYSLVLSFDQKDNFYSSKFQKNNFCRNYDSELQLQKMHQKIKNFIQKKQTLVNEVCQEITQINTLNSSSPYIFSQQNLIKILKHLKLQISQLSQTKRKCQDFNKTLLQKAKQCQNLKQQKLKLNQQLCKLNKQIQTLKLRNDKFLSQEMANSQKMSQLQYNMLILRKDLQETKKYEKCNRQTLDLQQQLKILGHQNTELQRQIVYLKQQNRRAAQYRSELDINQQILTKKMEEILSSNKKHTQTKTDDMWTQINQMSESERTNLQLKIKIQEQFQELCVEKLNLQIKITKLNNQLKQNQKRYKTKTNKAASKLQELRQKLQDIQCQKNIIKNQISRFFQQIFAAIIQNIQKNFLQNYCEVPETSDYEKIFYQTTEFTDQANECKIIQSQQKKDKQDQNMHLHIIADNNQQIKQLQQKVLNLQNLLQCQQNNFSLQVKNILDQKSLQSQSYIQKIEQLKLQKHLIQRRNQQAQLQHSKNLNQNQYYIQSLMSQLQKSQGREKQLEKQYIIKLNQIQEELMMQKEKQTIQQINKKTCIKRISSFIVDYKIVGTQRNRKDKKICLYSQTVSHFIYDPMWKNHRTQKQQNQVQTQEQVKQILNAYNQGDKKRQQPNTPNFLIYKCLQISIFPSYNQIINSNNFNQQIQMPNLMKKSFNLQKSVLDFSKPTKDDTFSTYLQKFKTIPSKSIQQYLANAMIKKVNQNQDQQRFDISINLSNSQTKEQQKDKTKIKASINHEALQSAEKKQKSQTGYRPLQEGNNNIQRSSQNNLKLVGSLYHHFDFKKGQKDQRQKDDIEFDLCI